MSGRFPFPYFSYGYLCILLIVSLFHLCTSNRNIDDDMLCLDSERQALLQFKHGLVDEAGRLDSWVDDEEERDCCRWAGIGCDNSTGHVHRIYLPALKGHCSDDDSDYISDTQYKEASKQRLRGNLSSSLLRLKQLRHLDLSCNDFGGIQVPKFIGSLRNLKYLNLSSSYFGGSIPYQLGNLSELQVLCLGNFHKPYETTSMMNIKWLSSLHLLQYLDLSGVDLTKATDWLQLFNTIPSLIQLHMSTCQLTFIHPHVASVNLTSLSVLDLSYNIFSSSFPQWIFSISSLVSLDLSECSFHGLIPNSIYTFGNWTSLESLNVGGNSFVNSSLVLKHLSTTIGSNLISLDINSCGISSSVLDSLHNLTSLLSIDLSYNELTKRIPETLGNLCNLRDLNLLINDFSNISLTSLLESVFKCKSPHLESLVLFSSKLSCTIPDSIGQLSFLRSLDLSVNQISGLIPYSIGELSSLRILHLYNNQLNGVLPNSIGRLSSLEELDLSFNNIAGIIPDSIGQLSFLTLLNLRFNLIFGPVPYSIGKLSLLTMLDLSNNRLNDILPYSIGRLSMLKKLDISHNQLNGSLPDSLGQLFNLIELTCSFNLLTGVVTEAHFSKLVNLKNLDGSGNNLTLRLRLKNWIPPFQLQYLNLNSWDLGGQFPMWLQSQKFLYSLNISNTRIFAPMPPESFWRSFYDLRNLDMSKNRIQGTLTVLGIPATLGILDLSSNDLTGELAPISNISLPLILDLSNNLFGGSLHGLLCFNGVQTTRAIYFGNNHFSGVIPECWEKWPKLLFLNLENNSFSGGIPETIGLSSQLGSLNMRGNKLSGRLPDSLMNLTKLKILQLGRNDFVGRIPSWFGRELSQLRILNLRSNNFDKNIPPNLCYLIHVQILDLAHNNLSGNIPSCFNNFSILTGKEKISNENFIFTGVAGIDVRGSDSLVMKGREDTYSSFLGLVTLLDFSYNNLVGNIPSELTSLRELKTLNFSRNRLTGRIPEKTGDMKSLETFDLSLNKLFGELPLSLSQLNFLSNFNVSYNNLIGRVPSSTQIQSFNESSFFGNKLCGPPLAQRCVPIEVPKKDDPHKQEDDVADWGLIVSGVLGFVFGFWIVLAPLIVSRSLRIVYFGFLNKLRYMVYDGMHKYCI